MQSNMAVFAPVAATWQTGWNICIVFDSGPIRPLCEESTMSSTKAKEPGT